MVDNYTFKMTDSKIENIWFIAAGLIIFWLFIANKKKNKEISELKNEIDKNQNLTEEIKHQLKALIQNNEEIDPKIANELSQIVSLLEIKQDTTAILKLAKIIENLLKELYNDDTEFKEFAKAKGRKSPVFADYIEHAKNKNVLSNEDFHLLSILKIIRNEEAHDLGIKKEKSRIIAVFISGLSLVLGLCKLLNKKSIVQSEE
jgi:flagellar biosynthesis chaperone FliJ